MDVATVLAIGMLVYLVKNVVHEGVGHGGACLLVGGEPLGISSAWFDASYDDVSPWARRFVKAAGTFANLALGAILIPVWFALKTSPRVHLRVFVWLLLVANLLSGAGYMLADPIGNFGDWSAFLEGLEPQLPVRVGIVAIGAALSAATIRFALRSVGVFLGGEERERKRRMRWLCLGPYVLGGVTFTLAGLLNPEGAVFAVTSALATFGGTAFLAWLPAWLGVRHTDDAPAPDIARSAAWIAAGVTSLVVIVGVLGPAIRFARD